MTIVVCGFAHVSLRVVFVFLVLLARLNGTFACLFLFWRACIFAVCLKLNCIVIYDVDRYGIKSSYHAPIMTLKMVSLMDL